MNKEKVAASGVGARLHVLLARDAPFAVIFRRGPTKQVCTIGWNLDHNTFKVGQWLKGRINEYFCDLSPDGEHLLYQASKYRGGADGAYTVFSRAPYLKALKIWHGYSFEGGSFLSNKHFILHSSEPTHAKIFRVAPFGEEKNEAELAEIESPLHTFHWRFERDGWKGSNSLVPDGNVEWIKEFAGWELKLRGNSGKFNYTVRGRRLEKTFDCARWQWADFREERLFWAQDGKLFVVQIWDHGHGPIQELADFNDWIFEPIIAPY